MISKRKNAVRHKKDCSPWALAMAHTQPQAWSDGLTEAEALFALMCWIGVPKDMAYSVVYPMSRATRQSARQLASRLLQDWRIIRLHRSLRDCKDLLGYRYSRYLDDEYSEAQHLKRMEAIRQSNRK